MQIKSRPPPTGAATTGGPTTGGPTTGGPTTSGPTPAGVEGASKDPHELTPMRRGRVGNAPLDVRLGKVVSTFGGPRFEAALDATTGSKVRQHNRAQLLFDGVNSFAERNKIIDEAKTSIHLQTFIFTDDDVGWALAQRLAGKAKEGVEVRVIVDAFGSQRSDPKLFQLMKDAGVDVRFHETGLNLLQANNRWHEKHLIVDGRVSIEGGMNIADEYALGGSGMAILSKHKKGQQAWRDVDVRIEGAAVHDAQRAFLRNWARLGAPAPSAASAAKMFPRPTFDPSGAEVRVVQHHPPDDHTMQLYVHAIRAATKSITIENAYLVPPRELREALKDAARRGVEVKILTNSKASGNHGFVVDAARYWYDELLRAGVQIWESNGGTLHSKTATFDGAYSVIGSSNMNGRSDGCDTEDLICVRDDKTASALEERFRGGVEPVGAATQITLDDVQKDSFVANLKQWAWASLSWTL